MNYEALEHNITDVIQEAQMKLGYEKKPISFFYPLEALNHLLEVDLSISQMEHVLENYVSDTACPFGRIEITHKAERFCITVPKEGVMYVQEHVPENEFLRDFLDKISRHGCTIEELLLVFQQYSGHVVFEKVEDGEFDDVLYFADGRPDAYRYCIHFEGEHAIYHRFTEKEYRNLIR